MSASDAKPGANITEAGKDAADARAERLSRALRENLKRRKAQARGRADSEGEPPSGDSA